MADETINSSPQKLNRSIHRSRLHRKTKRLNTTFTRSSESPCTSAAALPPNNEKTCENDLSDTLLIMYNSEDCEEGNLNVGSSRSPNEKQIFELDTDFDPFAEQRWLVLADRFGAPPHRTSCFEATQSFEPSKKCLLQPPTEKNILGNLKQTFEITDSELLQVCEETERKTDNTNIKQEKSVASESPATPESKPKTKSIVDLIFEDFCSSPASPEAQQSSEESNFHFRFANKPLRTYGRRREENVFARQNIAEQYEQAASSKKHCVIDGDDLLSNDSSTDLSVQEDLTQFGQIINAEPVVDLQHSQNLCENLQNLSAYFTELSGELDKKPEMNSETVTQQQLGQHKSIKVVLSPVEKSLDIHFKDAVMRAEELELQSIQQQVLTNGEGHISTEEDFKGFPSEDEDTCADMKSVAIQNCDIIAKQDDLENVEEEDDEWNDECDFFAKFDMDVALDAASTSKGYRKKSLDLFNNKELIDEPSDDFRTASNKTVIISAEAKERALKILQELPPLPTNTSYTDDLLINKEETEEIQQVLNRTITRSTNESSMVNLSNLEDKFAKRDLVKNYSNLQTNFDDKLAKDLMENHSILQTNRADRLSNFAGETPVVPSFVGFCTASNKKVTISKEAQQLAAKILEHLPPLPAQLSNIQSDNPSTSAATSNKSFIGFTTASNKTIKVSKEAQERAAKILEQLPELNVPMELESTLETMTKAQSDASLYTGFQTASRKTISISEEAQKRAALIMQAVMEEKFDIKPEECLENLQFSEWPVEEEDEEVHGEKIELKAPSITNACGSSTNICGFSTASKKTISISEIAKQKAAAILENLPQLPLETALKSTSKNAEIQPELQPIDNVVFSEWPLAEVIEEAPQTTSSNKRKHLDTHCVPNCEESSFPQHTPKLICKSVDIQRSPLAHLQSTATRSSLSELAVKTPPDYRAGCGLIARKNLLSLNKRHKLSTKSLQQCEQFKDECPTPETPTRSNRNDEPPSPPNTPNLREFFASACVNTSTPHPPTRQQAPMRTRARKRTELDTAATATPTNDISLKRIDWENDTLNKSASSLNASRMSNMSCSNITKMEANPTPKQRIERLRMYGKPPSVSPIYMSSTNNCRISGIKRRTRSTTKFEPEEESV